MKNSKKLFKLLLVMLISISVVSCDDNDNNDEIKTNTIADFVVANSENYSSLLAALQKADLVETLKGEGPFTVFAP